MHNDCYREPLVPPALRRIKRDDKTCCELRERSSVGTSSERVNNDVITSSHPAAATLPRERRSTIGGVVSQFNQLRSRRTPLDRMAGLVGGFIRRIFGDRDRRLSLLDDTTLLDDDENPALPEYCRKSQSNVSLDSLTRLQFEYNTPRGYGTSGIGKSVENRQIESSSKSFLPGKIPVDISHWNQRRHRLTSATSKYEYLPVSNQGDLVSAKGGNSSLKNFAMWQSLRRREKNNLHRRAQADLEFNDSDVDSAMSSDDDWGDPWVRSEELEPLGSIGSRRSVSSEIISMEGLPSNYQSLTNLYCGDLESRSSGMSSRLCFSSLAALGWEESGDARDTEAETNRDRAGWRSVGDGISSAENLVTSCSRCKRKLATGRRDGPRWELRHMWHQAVLT